MQGLFGLLAGIVGIVLFMLKKGDTPEAKRQKVLEKADDTLSQMDKALARQDSGDIADVWATLYNDVMLNSDSSSSGND